MAEPEQQRRWSRGRLLVVAFVVLVLALAVLISLTYRSPSPGEELALDELYALAADNQLQSLRFLDEQAVIVGERCLAPGAMAPAPPEEASAQLGLAWALTSRPPQCSDLTDDFHTAYPRSDVATQQLIQAVTTLSGAELTIDKQTPIAVGRLVAQFIIPLLMLATLFGLIFTTGDKGGEFDEIAGFGRMGGGKDKGKDGDKAGVGVTFADVAGADEAVAELREVIDYLTDPERFQAYGAAPPKGVMLFGPPGCGKTLLARATAGESGVPFFSVSGTEFVESLVGVGAARVRDLFRQVRAVAPAIVFIDEIDAVGRRRSGEGSSGGEREQTLNQLLVELDGFEVTAGIVLMGATNRPDILDPALLRPGRFDRHVTMQAPDVEGRRRILELHGRKRPLADDVDFEHLARRTPGFTGADLANVINEAALLAIRERKESRISATHLSEAVLRVLHGPQRRGQLLRPEDRRRLAYHESGHAVVAAAVGHEQDLLRVSILARGRGLGQALKSDDDERPLLTAGDMRASLTVGMAGVAAETLVFGESSTTAQDDLDQATDQARKMVGMYGMSSQLGRLRLLSPGSGYLGDGPTPETMSGTLMAAFEQEVARLMTAAEAAATELLTTEREVLDAMAERLQYDETLEGADLDGFLAPVRDRHRSDGNGSVHAADPEEPKAVPRKPRQRRATGR